MKQVGAPPNTTVTSKPNRDMIPHLVNASEHRSLWLAATVTSSEQTCPAETVELILQHKIPTASPSITLG